MVDSHHIEDGFIALSELQIIQFQKKIVCKCKFWFQEWSCYKNNQNVSISTETGLGKLTFSGQENFKILGHFSGQNKPHKQAEKVPLKSSKNSTSSYAKPVILVCCLFHLTINK